MAEWLNHLTWSLLVDYLNFVQYLKRLLLELNKIA